MSNFIYKMRKNAANLFVLAGAATAICEISHYWYHLFIKSFCLKNKTNCFYIKLFKFETHPDFEKRHHDAKQAKFDAEMAKLKECHAAIQASLEKMKTK